jgi:hypothetical protein
MGEQITQTPDTSKSFKEHADDVLAMNRETTDAHDAFMRQAAATAEQFAETTANNKRVVGGAIKDALLLTGTAASVAALGAVGGTALEHHAVTQAEQNQQWQQEAEESLHDIQMENGILPEEMQEEANHLNPEASPSPSEIPSPTQQPNSIQLPTLESPKTR